MLRCLAKCTYIYVNKIGKGWKHFLSRKARVLGTTLEKQPKTQTGTLLNRDTFFFYLKMTPQGKPACLSTSPTPNFQLSSTDLPARVTDPRLYSFSLSLFQTFEPLLHFISSHLLTPLLPGRDSPLLSDIQHRRQVVQGSPSPRAQSP